MSARTWRSSSTKNSSSLASLGGRKRTRLRSRAKRSSGRHAQDGMDLGVVLLLDPMSELAVETLPAKRDPVPAQRNWSRTVLKKSFDLSLGRAVPYRGVGEQAADAGADLDDFLGGVDGAVIDVEAGGHPAFVEGGAQGLNEGIDILGREELAVTTDPAGVIEEGNETGLDGDARRSGREGRRACRPATSHWRGLWRRPGGVCSRNRGRGLSISYWRTRR